MNKIITVSREFGSGGREIGKRLADELGFSYYDQELITTIAKETGMTEKYIEDISEKGIYPYAFQFAKSFTAYSPMQNKQTEILVTEAKILKKIAEKGNCVIVGRGANVILRDYNPMNIFVYSDIKSKIERCKAKGSETEGLSERDLEKRIIQINKERKKFHSLISNLEWGDKENYHLCINTSGLEIKNIISSLSNYTEDWFRRKE